MRRTTGATSGGLKLQCFAINTYNYQQFRPILCHFFRKKIALAAVAFVRQAKGTMPREFPPSNLAPTFHTLIFSERWCETPTLAVNQLREVKIIRAQLLLRWPRSVAQVDYSENM